MSAACSMCWRAAEGPRSLSSSGPRSAFPASIWRRRCGTPAAAVSSPPSSTRSRPSAPRRTSEPRGSPSSSTFASAMRSRRSNQAWAAASICFCSTAGRKRTCPCCVCWSRSSPRARWSWPTISISRRRRLPPTSTMCASRATDTSRSSCRSAIASRYRCAPERSAMRAAHSTLRLSLRTSVPHFVSSLSMSRAYSSGVEVKGSPPSARMRCLTCSVSTSARKAALRRSMIGRGVPAGASTP